MAIGCAAQSRRGDDRRRLGRAWIFKNPIGNSFEQYAGSFTLTTFAPGDYDFDGVVDTFDYNKWRSEFGTTSFKSDGNDDGLVDAADYVVWRKTGINSPGK